MKSLKRYINEKLVINKNYTDGYNYHPKNRDELDDVIQEHYDNDIYDLNDIDVSKISDFSRLFLSDKNTKNKDFNVSKWDVSNGTNFRNMFYNCNEFNCDLSKWDVSRGKNFYVMFAGCRNFNSDLSKWNVSNGEGFSWMFYDCIKFNSDLSKWDIAYNSDTFGMFNNCGIDDKYKPKGIE